MSTAGAPFTTVQATTALAAAGKHADGKPLSGVTMLIQDAGSDRCAGVSPDNRGRYRRAFEDTRATRLMPAPCRDVHTARRRARRSPERLPATARRSPPR